MANRVKQMAAESKRAALEAVIWGCASIVMQSIALAGLAWARVQDAGQPAVWAHVADAVGIGLLIIAIVKTRRMRRLQKKLDELVSLSRPRH